MATYGEALNNDVALKKILRSLLPRWKYVIIIIKESKDLTHLGFDQFVGSHEERLKVIGEIFEQAFDSNAKVSEYGAGSSSYGQGRSQRYST